jgi:hypothetical protein
MSANLDKFQILSLVLGASIVITVLVEYNAMLMDESAAAALHLLERGLPFLLAAYTLIVSGAPNAEARMYKNFIIGIIAVSWFIVIKDQITADNLGPATPTPGGWPQVYGNVLYPLAQGGLFALPIVLCGFRV